MVAIVIIIIAGFVIWVSSNSTHDHHVYTPPVAKKPLSVDEWNKSAVKTGMNHLVYRGPGAADISLNPTPQLTPVVPSADPNKGVWYTNGIKGTVPAVCIAQYSPQSGSMVSKEEATSWYIDPLIAGNPISAAEKVVADALDEFPVEYYREVSFLGMPLPSGKHMRVDFFIPDLCMVIEYDGQGWHNTPEQLARDKMKDEFCARWELTMIRVDKSHYYKMDYTLSGIMNKHGIKRK